MPLDARGAVVSALDSRGFCVVEERGFVDPSFFDLAPGAYLHEGDKRWRIPCNMLPSKPMMEVEEYTTPSGLVLRSYQCDGLRFIESAHRGCVYAAGVGLGKTITALAYVYRNKLFPFVIAGPLMASSSVMV